jgi:hypothetical protein
MKRIVYESLFEFERGLAPFDALDLGKLKKVEEWLSSYHIYRANYKINSDWSIDIKRSLIIIPDQFIIGIPDYIRFNECQGDFIIRGNRLLSMSGCPKIVHGDFAVNDNKLRDLFGSPIQVDGYYFIQNNEVKFTEEQIRKICKVGGKVKV